VTLPSAAQRPPAILFGAGLTVLGVLRSLGKAGVPVYCAHEQPPFVAVSRWCRYLPDGPIPLAPSEARPRIERLPFDSAVAIPCSDHWCEDVSRWSPPLSERFRTSLPAPEVLHRLIDKAEFGALLDRLGLPHPITVRITPDADPSRIVDQVPHAFLKPSDSQAFNKRFQRKAFQPTSPAELQENLAMIREAGLECILQEYLPGPPTNHYFVDGFVDRHGTITALFGRRRLRIFPPSLGNSTMMVTVPLEEIAGAVETVRALVAAVGYRGIFSAEFKLDDRDGLFKILEVNCRPWWFIGFASACGVDVATMAYRDALDLPVTPVRSYRSGVRCCYLLYDRHAYRALHEEGRLTWVGWVRSWAFGKHAVFDARDPAPSIHHLRRFVMDRVLPKITG
jgi:D-aspartate ligase